MKNIPNNVKKLLLEIGFIYYENGNDYYYNDDKNIYLIEETVLGYNFIIDTYLNVDNVEKMNIDELYNLINKKFLYHIRKKRILKILNDNNSL